MSPSEQLTSLKTVALVSGQQRPGTREFAESLIAKLREAEVEVLVDPNTAESCSSRCQQLPRTELVAQADMVIVMGGDGLLLRVARLAGPTQVPLLGVDLGSFGFLAAVQPAVVLDHVDQLLAGEYHIQQRLMLAVEVQRGAEVTSRLLALNDAVISRVYPRRMVRLDTQVDGERVAVYPADGLIVATPTGSTAYNLSAAGPLVDPDLDCLILTPICPHTLYLRPLIVDDDSVVTVRVEERYDEPVTVRLSVDGQEDVEVTSEDLVVIQKAPCKAQLVRLDEGSFFERLHTKLRWGLER